MPRRFLALGSLSGSSVCGVLPARPAVPNPDGAELTRSLLAGTQCCKRSFQLSLLELGSAKVPFTLAERCRLRGTQPVGRDQAVGRDSPRGSPASAS